MEKAHLHSNRKKPGVRRELKEVASGDILRAVASRYGCTKKDLLTAKRGSGVDNTARAMAMKLCQEQGSMKLLEIRELFGLGSDSGVTKVVSRLNTRMEKERELVSRYNVLCRDLTP